MKASDDHGKIPVLHYLMLFGLAAIWSSSFMMIKVAVVTIPPLTLTAVRVVIALVILYAILKLKGEDVPGGVRLWFLCFVIGLLGNGLPFTLIGWGEERVSSGLAAILMAVMPLATVVLAHFFTQGDRLTPQRLLGVAIGFGGIVVLVGPAAVAGLGGEFLRQAALAGAAVCYAVAAVIARNVPPSPLLGRSVVVMFWACVQLVPVALIFDKPWTLEPTAGAVWSAVYLGAMPTALATIIYFHLISLRGAGFFAFINYLIPCMGVVWGAAFLGERVEPQAVAALAMILSGLAVANMRRGKHRPS